MSLSKILDKQNTRITYLEKDLFTFGVYYFTDIFRSKSPSFHKQWCKDMMTDKHIELIWFRESWKTVWAMIKILHNIVYKKKRFMMFYCYDKKKATSRLYDTVVQLQTNRKLINDFWELFPSKREDKDDWSQKKSIPDFITKNKIKVKASSIWESPRWEMYFAPDWSFRPDYIILDDIDVDKSVSNVEIIEKNYLWLKGELMGGMSEDCQILFLGNIIKSDGIVPRFEKDYKENENWIIRRKAVVENNEITWSERYTWESLEKKKKMLWEISYNQNMLLIPYSWGDTIIKRHHIQYREESWFKRIIVAVDPAISEKTKSDKFAIVVTWQKDDCFYVLESIELSWEQKDPFKATQVVKSLYDKWKANVVIVETVAFQQVMQKLFMNSWMATKETKPHRDKITRLMEKQWLFEQGKIFFSSDGTNDLVTQLIDFPNVLHDDLVDAFVYSIEDKKKSFMMVNL